MSLGSIEIEIVIFPRKDAWRSRGRPSLTSKLPALALGVLESLPDLDRASSKIIYNEVSVFTNPEFKRHRRPTAGYLTDLFFSVYPWLLLGF
jgi:hypothetical protein